jgi:hypothetical protein
MLCSPFTASAGPFEVAISPSRFELSGKPGARIGQSLNIYNVGATPTQVSIRTLDWTYSEQGAVSYHEELLPGSCRPWVTLERNSLRLAPRNRSSFRFQVDVPPDAPRTECRFMLSVEGTEPAQNVEVPGGTGTQLSLPVNGRIAVAVYVLVNGAAPKLEVKQVGMVQVNGKPTPAITISNTGDAHGRIDGALESVDAKGQKFDLLPESTPILPGQTRTLPFSIKVEPNRKTPEPVYPVKAEGQLDWDLGSFKIKMEFQ